MDRNWRATRQQAYAYLRGLERPSGITPRQWVGVKQFLYLIARGQPKAYKGQERMAEEMGVNVRTIQRYVDYACAAGILTVRVNAGVGRRGNPRKTHQYLFTELLAVPDNLSGTVGDNLSDKYPAIPPYRWNTGREENPGETSSPLAPLRSGSAGPTLEPVGKISAGEALAAANARGYATKRPRAKDPAPSRRLLNYFLDQWEAVVRDHDLHPDVRVVDSLRQNTDYLKAHFLAPAAGRVYTEAEVKVLIDEFMVAVLRRQARLKPGQSAFMCFTGWWGRRKAPAHDPTKYDRYR